MYRAAIFSSTILISGFISGAALASDTEGAYVNIGATLISTDVDLTQLELEGQSVNLGNQSLNITMATGRVGYWINSYFAVEGELGFGLGGDDFNQAVPVDVLGTPVNVDTNVGLDIKSYYGAFGRFIMPVSEQFDIFARAGYGQANADADITASVAGFSASGSATEKASGFAYGAGAQFNITDKDGIRADFTRLEDTNIISLSYARRF
jgi:opacity protein-like surface antigen